MLVPNLNVMSCSVCSWTVLYLLKAEWCYHYDVIRGQADALGFHWFFLHPLEVYVDGLVGRGRVTPLLCETGEAPRVNVGHDSRVCLQFS